MNSECNRCGKCCHYEKTEKGKYEPCKYLRVSGNGNFRCSVYKTRLGRYVGVDYRGISLYCNMYGSLPREIKGCPLNTGQKPTIDIFI